MVRIAVKSHSIYDRLDWAIHYCRSKEFIQLSDYNETVAYDEIF